MNDLKPDSKIISFIRHHHLMALATLNQGKPWTASCFYVYLEESQQFIFTSALHTLHSKNMIDNQSVAGNIALETKIIGKIQGIQFTGTARKLSGEELKQAKKFYIRRFPVAMLMETELWALDIEMIKMTDNKLGFGKKLYWYKDSENTMKREE
ncbi:MAG: pyridoxamine 5'-phosphate oxidase family protein [Bacteroidales bacterium]